MSPEPILQPSIPGLLVTFEGIDGSGKTSLARSLYERFQQELPTLLLREPGGSSLGQQVRQWLLHQLEPLTPMAELLLFLAARAQNVQQMIAPALAQGTLVLCDRYIDSSIAYQGAGRGLPMEQVRELCYVAIGPYLPALTFLLDLDPSVARERIKRRQQEDGAHGPADRIEQEERAFHERVRQGYLSLKQADPRIVLLDATQGPDLLYQQAYHYLQQHLQRLLGKRDGPLW